MWPVLHYRYSLTLLVRTLAAVHQGNLHLAKIFEAGLVSQETFESLSYQPLAYPQSPLIRLNSH